MNDDINVQIKSTVLEGFGKRKAMFMPMVCVSSFMLVGYAALDTEAPEVLTTTLELEINQEIDPSLIEVVDNLDDRSAITVNIDQSNYDKSVAGEYKIYVTASDSFNNVSDPYEITVVTKDKQKPVISYKADGTNYSSDSNVLKLRYNSDGDIRNYIVAMDNDTNSGNKGDVTDFVVANTIDTSKLGMQFIPVSVSDDAGNEASETIPVYIIDDVAPELELKGNGAAKINYGSNFDLSEFANAIDEYEGNLSDKIVVEGTAPNTNRMGASSTLKLTVEDSSGNKTVKELTLTVADTSAPTISFSKNNFAVAMDTDPINVAEYVKVTDNYDSTVANVTYSSPTIDTSTKGEKSVTVTATDAAGNKTTKSFNVTVYDPDTYANSIIVNTALSKVGGPYVWGGTGPVGFDCSGLAQYCYRAAGKSIPRVVHTQYYACDLLIYSYADLQPGDLVFFHTEGWNTHVGIYIGGGEFVHAGSSRTGIVRASLYNSYWQSVFFCGGRFY